MKRLRHPNLVLFLFSLLLLFPALAFASSEGEHHSMPHIMTNLVFQIGIIIFAAKVGGKIFEKIKMPSVLGELAVGIVIGPYLLGKVPFWGFPDGLFPISSVTSLPISTELYGIATIASIILLFAAGLETDFQLFLKFSVAGIVLGIGGVVISFVVGSLTAVYFMNIEFMNPVALFFGVISTATSVGITARILSERRKMDSPEGVSIMAGAVIDDILGIIILAIVLGIAKAQSTGNGAVAWAHIGIIAFKAVIVWLVFTAIGLIFSYKISSFLKISKSVSTFSILSLGLALILAGIFEKAGLAMIVGAYVMGLSLSRTDLAYVIHETLHTIQKFFVPVFFTVMGMLVNPFAFASKEVLYLGLIYSVGAVIAKIVGCGIPAMFLKFNKLGAIRIGLGMVPRGEVALIVAGIGLSNKILDESVFGVSIMMTLFTTVIAPPLLNIFLKKEGKGTTKNIELAEKISTTFAFPSPNTTSLIEPKIIETFYSEGFFINVRELDHKVYNIMKDRVVITCTVTPYVMEFKSDKSDTALIKHIMYESLLTFQTAVKELTSLVNTIDMTKELVSEGRTDIAELKKYLHKDCITTDLKGSTKDEIVEELIDLLYNAKEVSNKKVVLSAVLEREQLMSTGLSDGLAIPHAKCDGINEIKLAIGMAKKGKEFDSIDQQPSNIFFLIVSPEHQATSHLQMVSTITSLFSHSENRKNLLECSSNEEVYLFLTQK